MSKLAAFIAAFSFVFIQFVHAAVLDGEHVHYAGKMAVLADHHNHDHHHEHVDEHDSIEVNDANLGHLHQALHDHLTFTLQAMSLFKDPVLFDDSYLDIGLTTGSGSKPAPPVPPPYS